MSAGDGDAHRAVADHVDDGDDEVVAVQVVVAVGVIAVIAVAAAVAVVVATVLTRTAPSSAAIVRRCWPPTVPACQHPSLLLLLPRRPPLSAPPPPAGTVSTRPLLAAAAASGRRTGCHGHDAGRHDKQQAGDTGGAVDGRQGKRPAPARRPAAARALSPATAVAAGAVATAQVRTELEARVGTRFPKLSAVSYTTQVVAGINYFVKVAGARARLVPRSPFVDRLRTGRHRERLRAPAPVQELAACRRNGIAAPGPAGPDR